MTTLAEAAASLVVPIEEAPAPIAAEVAAPAIEQGDPVVGEEDARTDEEKALDEIMAEDLPAEEPEEEIPAAPHSWSKEDADAWKGLTPEARDVVLRREQERDKFIAETGRKSAEARKVIERQAMEAVASHAEDYAQRLALVMQQTLPRPPDQRLLYSQDPNAVLEYQRQDATYRAAQAQHQAMQQELDQAKGQANTARTQAQQSLQAEEAQRLADQLPEWNDPSARTKLLSDLQGVGTELGYSTELMAEAGATDILALKKAAEWRSDAMKYRKIVGKRMETVRAAKTLPKMTRPGAGLSSGAQQQSAEVTQANIDRFNRERSPEAAAALLMTGQGR